MITFIKENGEKNCFDFTKDCVCYFFSVEERIPVVKVKIRLTNTNTATISKVVATSVVPLMEVSTQNNIDVFESFKDADLALREVFYLNDEEKASILKSHQLDAVYKFIEDKNEKVEENELKAFLENYKNQIFVLEDKARVGKWKYQEFVKIQI